MGEEPSVLADLRPIDICSECGFTSCSWRVYYLHTLTHVPRPLGYEGYEAMDKHGARWRKIDKSIRDNNGLRYQIGGPWSNDGCTHNPNFSHAWAREIVRRRDADKCQSCGRVTKEGEVQHIIPRTTLATMTGLKERTARNYLTNTVHASIYLALGNCPHNLAWLCKRCHKSTFKLGYAGIPKHAPPFVRSLKGHMEENDGHKDEDIGTTG